MPYPAVLNIEVPTPIHVIPSVEYPNVFELPPATNRDPFHVIDLPTENILDLGVHVIPSEDVTIVFAPCPSTTQREPFHATLVPAIEIAVIPLPVHVIPSGDVAIVFTVPFPTATN